MPYANIRLHTEEGLANKRVPFDLQLSIRSYVGDNGRRISLMRVFERGDAYHETNAAPVLESTQEIIQKFRAALDEMERDLSPAAAAAKSAPEPG